MGAWKMNASPSSTSLGNIQETTLANQTKVIGGVKEKSIQGTIRSTLGASPPHLSGRTGRGSKASASVGTDCSAREGKLW